MKYRHIVAWGRYLGSYKYYIDQQVYKAGEDKAPEDAIYYSDDENRWVTVDEIKNPTTRETIEMLAGELP